MLSVTPPLHLALQFLLDSTQSSHSLFFHVNTVLQMARIHEASVLAGSREAPHTRQSFLHKLSPLPGLILTTVLSAVLLYGINQPPFIDDYFYNFIYNHRATTQAILSLLIHLFCLWNLYVLNTVINFSTRIRLLGPSHPTLAHLKLWKALAAHKLDGSLPYSLSLYLPMIVVLALAFLPGFLWTGALTPNTMTRNVIAPIDVPLYAPDPDGTSWNATWTPIAPHDVKRIPSGSFSYTPAYDRGGSMINTAAGVVFDKDRLGIRPRSDKSGFTYSSRSYGVGAGVGLLSNFNNYSQVSAFQYQEIGYHTKINCTFNTSSQWGVSPLVGPAQDTNPLLPNIYVARGDTPDHELYWQLQYSAVNDSNVVSINAHPDSDSTGNGTVVIATGNGPYKILNQTQCSVRFTPTLFNISVDAINFVINVTAGQHAEDMDPTARTNATFTAWECQTLLASRDDLSSSSNDIFGCSNYTAQGQTGLGNIATRALRQLNDLSTLDTSLHRSDLGEMFLSDFQDEILFDVYNKTGSTPDISEQINSSTSDPNTSLRQDLKEYSIVQGLKSLLDDSLLAFASAQLVLNYNTSHQTTNATLTVDAVQVGTKGFIYTLFAFNILLFLIYIEEMIRTRFWAALPDFDPNDLKSVLTASSMDGGDLLKEAGVVPSSKSGSMWGALFKNNKRDNLRVRLVKGSLQLMDE
jgi:hypothetical protein